MDLSRLDIEALPNYKRKNNKEYSAACPNCGAGEDRFIFWPEDGNYWCRQCDLKGFILETDQSYITDAQREAWKRAEKERKRREKEQENTVLSSISQMEPLIEKYHHQLGMANGFWQHAGLEPQTIERYKLGYCQSCPTCPNHPSYVIPVYQQNKLVTIRHRLESPPTPGDKYRYHMAGMKAQLFNVDSLKPNGDIPFGLLEPGEVLLVEGEIKSMYLDQSGFMVVGVPGANIWRDEWGQFFGSNATVFVAYDPGANGAASKTALKLSNIVHRVYQVSLPSKPDDFFVIHNGKIDEFMSFLRWGRLVR